MILWGWLGGCSAAPIMNYEEALYYMFHCPTDSKFAGIISYEFGWWCQVKSWLHYEYIHLILIIILCIIAEILIFDYLGGLFDEKS